MLTRRIQTPTQSKTKPLPSRRTPVRVDSDHLVVQGLWPDPDHGPWYFRLFFRGLNGRPECLGVELRSFRWPQERSYTVDGEGAGSFLMTKWQDKVDPTPLTTEILRSLNVGGLVRSTKQQRAEFDEWLAAQDERDAELLMARASQWKESSKGTGGARRQWTTARLAEVAAVYLHALDRGEPPTKAVEEHLLYYSYSHAARIVSLARRAGLLGPTRKGKAGP